MTDAFIPLSGPNGQGLVAIVDEKDLEKVAGLRWYVHKAKGSRTIYAKTSGGKRTLYMHRLIMPPRAGFDIDHIDGDGLNNRSANLRYLTHGANISAGWTRREFDRIEHLL